MRLLNLLLLLYRVLRVLLLNKNIHNNLKINKKKIQHLHHHHHLYNNNNKTYLKKDPINKLIKVQTPNKKINNNKHIKNNSGIKIN